MIYDAHFFSPSSFYAQLMTALCKMPGGHSRVSEALTTLRLNMGESVIAPDLHTIPPTAFFMVPVALRSRYGSSS